MNGLLARFADFDGVIAYNNPSALGALAAARGAGRELTAIGLNGGSDGIAGVRDRRLAATVQLDVVGEGVQPVIAAYKALTEQNTSCRRSSCARPGSSRRTTSTKIKTWDDQIDELRTAS